MGPEAFYRRYLTRCNEHRFDELAEFVAPDVQVNGRVQGLTEYAAGLTAVVASFPDYAWDLRRLIVDGAWLAVRLLDTGTHRGTFHDVAPTGRRISTIELVLYRIEDGRIAEVWTVADNLGVLGQLR